MLVINLVLAGEYIFKLNKPISRTFCVNRICVLSFFGRIFNFTPTSVSILKASSMFKHCVWMRFVRNAVHRIIIVHVNEITTQIYFIYGSHSHKLKIILKTLVRNPLSFICHCNKHLVLMRQKWTEAKKDWSEMKITVKFEYGRNICYRYHFITGVTRFVFVRSNWFRNPKQG